MRKSIRVFGAFTFCLFTMQPAIHTMLEVADTGIELRPRLTYESVRKGIARENLAAALERDIPSNFWIDACCSGGGFRAMLATAGFVAGLIEIGLFNCISNMTGLSGSTWMIGPFMAKNMPIEDFVSRLRHQVTDRNFYDHVIPTMKAIASTIERRFAGNREIQLVDLYGGLIADRLMGDMGSASQDICLSDFANQAMATKYPHPIFTTIHPHKETGRFCLCCNKPIYRWIEITPDTTRQVFSRSCIPTCRLGMPLRSPDLERPLLPLSSILGFCGSAFACNAQELIAVLKSNLLERFQKEERERAGSDPHRGIILRELISTLRTGRLAPGMIPNFTDCDDEMITIVDAGIHLNLPVIPLLERRSPIMIFCDADASRGTYHRNYPQLRKVATWAAAHGHPFPSISPRYAEEKNEHLLVFKRNEAGLIDPHLPTVLYFHNPIEKSTFEFNYTVTEFDSIIGYMQRAVCASAQDIRIEIQEKIALLS